jgi:hypothetical protein
MNGDALIFLAAGAIFVLASRRSNDEALEKSTAAVPDKEDRDHPATCQLYVEPNSNDLYFQNLMRSGAKPVRFEYGAMGLPVYIYSRAGGRSFYKVYNPHSLI